MFRQHLEHEFSKRHSPNTLTVQVKKAAEWWLGDTNNALFAHARAAVHEVWGVEPLHVREGGTNPLTSFMERVFDAPAIHLPLGQCTDNAHLPNERLALYNLQQGKDVIRLLLERLGAQGSASKARLSQGSEH